jgi:hypothetical protein
MQKRIKILLINVLKTPLVLLISIPITLIAHYTEKFYDMVEDKLPRLEPVPMSDKEQDRFDAAKEARKQVAIAAMKGNGHE